MTRAQFLNDLYRRLHGLTQEQAEQHLTYYAEMLADRMEEGMSEDEAVASMEPLDTIAQRILQDEGIPAGSPPDAGAAQPPQYPELPNIGAQFTKVPDKPRRKNWKKAGAVLLWVVAILTAVTAIGRKISSFSGDGSYTDYGATDAASYVYEEASEHAPYFSELEDIMGVQVGPSGIEGDGFYIGPDGILVNGFTIGPDGIGLETADEYPYEPVSSQYACLNDTYQVDRDISEISISWTTGAVEVRGWDGDCIQFQEYSGKPLAESKKLTYSDGGSMLTISDNIAGNKGLCVMVPNRMLVYLCVDTTSADVYWNGLSAEHGQIYATSGDVMLKSVAANTLYLQSSSGKTVLQSVAAAEMDVDATSGSIVLNGVAAEDGEIYTSSGSVKGTIAFVTGQIETTSGNIDLTAGLGSYLLADTSSGKVRLTLADSGEASNLGIETASGDVELVLPEDMGFSLGFDSSSGYLDKGNLQVVRSDGRYVSGDGSCVIEVVTSSGDLRLQAK